MAIDWPAIVDGGLPLVGGLYATAIGTRKGSTSRAARQLRWLGPLVAVFGLFTLWQSHTRPEEATAAEIARGIAMKSGLPKRVDAVTTAEDVTGAGNTITFHYSVASTLKDDNAQADAEVALHHQLVATVCNSKARQLLSDGYTVEGRYVFAGGREVLATVTPASCGG